MPPTNPTPHSPPAANTPPARGPCLALVIGFLALLAIPPLFQTVVELRRHEMPQALDLFRHPPTTQHLRRFEERLEDQSIVARTFRPWAQWARFHLLRDAGDQAFVGPDGWWFYRPGLQYLTRRPPGGSIDREIAGPLRAILDFRDQLAARGIQLLAVPAPNKESIHPEHLARGIDPPVVPPLAESTRALLAELRAHQVPVLDLFELFGTEKQENPAAAPTYLRQDSHWSPHGLQLAARAAADRLGALGVPRQTNSPYATRAVPLPHLGDVVRMLRSPPVERSVTPEQLSATQVILAATGTPFRDDPEARVLVMGDSFLRIFERDEPGSAGFIAHLARELGQPVAALLGDGGASTLVRQELFRRPALLRNKRVVVWEFVERDIRFGTEGWQIIPLPPPPPP